MRCFTLDYSSKRYRSKSFDCALIQTGVHRFMASFGAVEGTRVLACRVAFCAAVLHSGIVASGDLQVSQVHQGTDMIHCQL